MATVLVTRIVDRCIEDTTSHDFASLAEANVFADWMEKVECVDQPLHSAFVGCVKDGKKITRVF